jgi:DNA-3-methyladenine glycosylase II
VDFRLEPSGPFSLAASTRFLEGFAPAGARPPSPAGHLHLAFAVEGSWAPVAVCLRQDDGGVAGSVEGDADLDAVRAQVSRILSLDVDGSGFPEIGGRDDVIARLQGRYPGLRPVGFWSPYEAAAWAVVSQRVRIVQAAAIRQRLAEELGPVVAVHGQRLAVFPAPRRLAAAHTFPGLSPAKVERLRGLAGAALDGDLTGPRLRGGPADAALAALQRLPGIGPFSAELVLVRGAGAPDVFPSVERRLHDAMRTAYGLAPGAGVDELLAIAERWRPYRSWASFLLRAGREDEARESGGGRP